MPNVDDLKKSRFLTQRDVEKPMLATISGYDEVNVSLEGAEPEMRWALIFKELDKPFVLNSTNGQIIAAIAGSGELDDWKGCKVVLYVDPNITFRGNLVGGIRVRAPKKSAQKVEQPIEPPVTEHREQNEPDAPEPEEITNPDYVGNEPTEPPDDGVPF